MTSSSVTFVNTGGAKLSGVDYTIDWKAALSDMGLHSVPGRVGINFIVSQLLKEETQQSADAAPINWVGSIGPPETTTLNAGAFRYRMFTTFNYSVANVAANLRWRHLPSAVSVLQAEAAGTSAASTITQLGATTSYDIFDFSASYSFNQSFQVRFGIDNVFDTPPVITGERTAKDPQPTSGAGVTEPGFYDVLGRQFYLGVKAKF
jgi:outer membrane receptor protein involved in Fe transport